MIIFGKSHPKQEQYDIERDKLEAKIEEKYRLKYEKYENVTLKDYKMFQLINLLSREKRDKVYEFAYSLYKQDKDPA